MNKDRKELVFISHATPEDNLFTLWLSTRLKLLGYEVWSDVTELFGGEKWWDDIEGAVRNYTRKFIIIITRTSLSKPGVQREVELALEAEKKNKLPNFILPIIIDDSPFGGQPYGLSDRNIIPFQTGWVPALAKLVERLERDRVPSNDAKVELGSHLASLIKNPFTIIKQKDIAVSNTLKINSFPECLNFYRLPINPRELTKKLESWNVPWFEWRGMISTFANSDEMQSQVSKYMSVNSEAKLTLDKVIKNEPRNHPDFLRSEVFKKVNNLISNAWEKNIQRLGLHCYELSNGRKSFFFPKHKDFEGKLPFPDIHGTVKKKQVLGFSAKNKVYWHYSIEAKPMFGVMPTFKLIPHVAFSEDGKNVLSDKAKLLRLRRGFCKSWWNERWRDMLLVYLNLLSNGKKEILIPVGGNQFITMSSRPLIYDSPISLVSSEDTINEIEEESDVKVEIDEELEGDDYVS